MSSQVYYRKWRPQTLSEVVGQEAITQTLRNALKSSRVSHAYLFCGPRGTGKTSTARILAKSINCLNPANGEPCGACISCQAINESRAMDIIEIDAASNTGVDDIRSLREKVNYAPNQAKFKVYIIDEVHMLSNSASNALLKTLEEPPPHVIFVLATTEAHKILPTILSRCQRFDFHRLTQADIIKQLTIVSKGEGITIEQEALRLIAKSATGAMRDALNILQQLNAHYGSEITLSQVQALLGITGDWRSKELAKYIVTANIAGGMATILSVNSDGLDLKQFNRELVEYLRDLLLIKTDSAAAVDLTPEDIADLKEMAAKASLEKILTAVKLFGQLEFGFDSYSTLPLELALIDSALASAEAHGVVAKESAHPELVEGSGRMKQSVSEPAPKVASASAVYNPKPVSKPEPAASKPPAPPKPAPVEVKAEAKPEVKPEVKAEHKAPAPEAPAKAEKSDAAPAGTEIERLKEGWKQLVSQAPVSLRKSIAVAILRSAPVKIVSIENSDVTLSFRNKIHKDQIEKLENQHVVEQLISSFLGRPCHVKCVLENGNHLLKEAMKLGAEITDLEDK